MIPNDSQIARQMKSYLNKLGPVLALLLVYFFFAILNMRMLSLNAIEIIIQQTVIVGVSAIGMTLVIIAGGIDLSAGSIIAFSSVVIAMCMEQFGFDPLVAAPAGVLAGLCWGLINGLIITRFKVVPFIVTLGTLLVVRGIAKGLSNSMPINIKPTWLSELLATLPPGRQWQLFPPGAWIMILLALIVAGMLKYTRLGRHIYAVGSNEQTARLCGVAVERIKCIVYATAGAFSGFAGLMIMSYQEQGDPTGAVAMELDVIAAVVIGGGSLSGGVGSISGTIIGAIIMTVIRTGSQLNGWPTWVTQVATGVIIVIAVAVDRLRQKE
jgi:ribose transport system permease protein